MELATSIDQVENTPIALPERLVQERTIVRRRWDFGAAKWQYDRDVKPIDIAKDFIEDVLLKVLASG